MLDTQMHFTDGGKLRALTLDVAGSAPPAMVFQYWMAEVARDLLRLGIYFRGMAIMLQVPGAAEYEWLGDDDEPPELYQAADRNTLLNVLADCLERLGVPHLMQQVPAPDYEAAELPAAWKRLIARRVKLKNGLLTVVAECLDELVVRPGLAALDAETEQPWWKRWRPQA